MLVTPAISDSSKRVVHCDYFDPGNQVFPDADLIYVDPPFNTGRKFEHFNDHLPEFDYFEWLEKILEQASKHLKINGNFILHLDWHVVHYAKVLCDRIFGKECFQNEIIWSYNSGGASKKRLARKHDTLLWYTKSSEKWTFNVIREPYATTGTEGRPGFHPDGRMLTDVWPIGFLSTGALERTGYSTQKPLTLLERIVRIFSNPGDMVFDPMCGSGTTLVAAKKLGRDFFGCDSNEDAVNLTRERLDKVDK